MPPPGVAPRWQHPPPLPPFFPGGSPSAGPRGLLEGLVHDRRPAPRRESGRSRCHCRIFQPSRSSSNVTGLTAVGAFSARSNSAHETPALTALLAQQACFAFRALVDGVSLSWPSGWQHRRGQVPLMTAAPQHLTAPVGAGDPSPARWQRPGADHTAWRYGTVTRRHLGSPSRCCKPASRSPRNAPAAMQPFTRRDQPPIQRRTIFVSCRHTPPKNQSSLPLARLRPSASDGSPRRPQPSTPRGLTTLNRVTVP